MEYGRGGGEYIAVPRTSRDHSLDFVESTTDRLLPTIAQSQDVSECVRHRSDTDLSGTMTANLNVMRPTLTEASSAMSPEATGNFGGGRRRLSSMDSVYEATTAFRDFAGATSTQITNRVERAGTDWHIFGQQRLRAMTFGYVAPTESVANQPRAETTLSSSSFGGRKEALYSQDGAFAPASSNPPVLRKQTDIELDWTFTPSKSRYQGALRKASIDPQRKASMESVGESFDEIEFPHSASPGPMLSREHTDTDRRTFVPQMSNAEDDDAGLSVWSAVFLLVTAIVGCGVVALPSLMKLGGWVIVPVMALATSLAFMEIGEVIDKAISLTEHENEGSHINSFEDFGRAAYAERGAFMVRTITTTGFFGTLVVYTILISQNVYTFFNGALRREYVLALLSPVLLSLAMLKDLQAMAKIMPIGVFASLTSCCLICVKAGIDARQWQDRPPEVTEGLHSMWPEELNSLGTIMAVLFSAYSVMGTVPSIRGQMKKREDFLTAFRYAIVVVFIVYFFVMTTGYYGYGNCVEENVVASMMNPPFVLKHQNGDEKKMQKSDRIEDADKSMLSKFMHGYGLGTLMTALVSTYLFIGFALFFACVMGMVQSLGFMQYFELNVPMSKANCALRVVIVVGVSAIGLCVPHFREVMAIMSSVCCSCNNVFFPLLFSNKLVSEFQPDQASADVQSPASYRRISHYFIFAMAVFCASLGLKDSVTKLLKEMSEDS